MMVRAAFLALALASTALPVAVADETPLTVEIVGVEAQRVGDEVEVRIALAGTAPGVLGLLSLPAKGSVSILTDTPCWPDAGSCSDVLTTHTEEFLALPGLLGVWNVEVGPFAYPAGEGESVCATLTVAAHAEAGDQTASDRDAPTVCA
jgi:hypothetical protein